MNAKRVVIISDQPEEGINGSRGENFEKIEVLRQERKTLRERPTSDQGSEDGEELDDDKGSN